MRKSLKRLIRSMKSAFQGIIYAFCQEVNFRIQFIVAVLVLVLAWYLPLQNWERVVVIMLVGLVLILELANSVMERLIDLFRPRIDNLAKHVKDILAGAVLLAVIISIVVGLKIFLPYLKALF